MANRRIVCFGDSITQGALDTEGGWADRLKRSLTKRELDGTDGHRYQVYNLGIGGDTSEDLIRRLKPEMEARLSKSWQNTFIIAIGINDSRFNNDLDRVEISLDDYKANLKKIVTVARQFSDKICLIGITPVAEDRVEFKQLTYINDDIEKYDNVLGQVAEELGISKLDIFAEAKNNTVFMDSLNIDKLHPDQNGHKWLHERIEQFLLKFLES